MPSSKVTIRDVYEQIQGLREEVKDGYVSKDKFQPVERLVFGVAGVVLVSIVTAIVTFFIK